MSIMSNELHEAPRVVKDAVEYCTPVADKIAKECSARNLKRVIVAARGSSLNAGIGFKFFLETQSPYVVAFEYPSVITLYKSVRNLSDALYVVVSQSGKGPDTVEMATAARRDGALVVSVTNGLDNPVARIADFTLDIAAGEEKAVAATKTLTGELAALEVLAAALSGKRLAESFAIKPVSEALELPLPEYPEQLTSSAHVVVLARGLTEAVAKECALKLTETCYLFSFASSVNEFQHGPKALIGPNTPVILFAPVGECTDSVLAAARDLKTHGAYVIAFTDSEAVASVADTVVPMPSADKSEVTLVYTVRMQQFVANLCELLGLSPDAPRNLRKITITK